MNQTLVFFLGMSKGDRAFCSRHARSDAADSATTAIEPLQFDNDSDHHSGPDLALNFA
ncbi:hypothetical protein [Paraburkholderia sp. JHI869]|uniref:hypothetical protein n=1 Tax=Paraburkholderia sp. JHI869 TaxID=3112959 RepID=UPI0031738FA4